MFPGGSDLRLDCEEVDPKEMPSPYRNLLVHSNHLTAVLTRHYGMCMDLHIRDIRQEGELYSRKILLALTETPLVASHGIARIDLGRLTPRVRDAVIREHAPLGSILINHNVMRRIEPRWYLRFALRSAILEWFEAQTAGPLYGRVTTIYCDLEPAIELLEIVTGLSRRTSPPP